MTVIIRLVRLRVLFRKRLSWCCTFTIFINEESIRTFATFQKSPRYVTQPLESILYILYDSIRCQECRQIFRIDVARRVRRMLVLLVEGESAEKSSLNDAMMPSSLGDADPESAQWRFGFIYKATEQ